MKFKSARFLEMMPQLRGLFHYAQVLDSSNDTAADLIASGSGSGTLVLAEYQTSGRGRGGNAWLCPADQGLLFSMVLEPDIDRSLWSRFSLVSALAVVRSLRKLGVMAEVKWPNDVWINRRKVAGILVEGCGEFLIVGIGINVEVQDFPDGVEATSVVCELGEQVSREALLSEVVRELLVLGSLAGPHFGMIVEEANQCSALAGQRVRLQQGDEWLEGTAVGVSQEGFLMLHADDGVIHSIAQANTVRVVE